MKRSLAMVGVSLAVLGILYGPARASTTSVASTTKQDVRVVNTTAEAVPVAVQGTATVSGGVRVTNTPTVGLDPSKNGVQIVNPETAPLPVRVNSALTHVGVLAGDVVTLYAEGPAGVSPMTETHSDGSTSTFTTVPAGKALVITDVECVGAGNAGDVAGFQIALYGQGGGVVVFDVRDKLDTNGFASRMTSMTTGITVGPGVALSLFVDGGGHMRAHGYYVDAP
jgi:hypothetical protein